MHLSDGDVIFFRVSFSHMFSRRAIFLEPVVKTCHKEKIC